MLDQVERPVKRRSSRQVQAEQADYEARLVGHFQAAMEAMSWPDYVQSNSLLSVMYRQEMTITLQAFQRHCRRVMNGLGWERVDNPASKDGRWRACSESFHVYGRSGRPAPSREKLAGELGW